MKYQRIIFLQGNSSDEVLNILDNQGKDEALEYLKQWDYGEDGELFDEPSKGTSDRSYIKEEYIMSYNFGLNYIGLERIIL